MDHMNLAIPLGVVLGGSLIAAVTDVWKFKVYNVLTLPLLLTGLLFHAFAGGASGLSGSLVGVLVGFAILFPFYLMGGMGAGDVKLMAAVGAWLGMPMTFYVFLASSLAAAVYAVTLLVLYRGLGETWINMQIILHRLLRLSQYLGADDHLENEMKRTNRRHRTIPFAAIMLVGVIAVIVWTRNAGTP